MAKRERNLAGLAALGALGMYMARGDKKTAAEAAATPVEDRGTMPQAASAAQTAGFEDTRGMESGIEPLGLRRNQESGDLYDPTGRVLGGPAVRPAAPRPRIKPYSKAEAMTDLARETARGRRGPIATPFEREPDYVASRKPNVIYNAKGDEVRPLKKGGAVKMASGGSVSSASRRGDGIAQRGKTKGRMR